jgi:hypothetical protein
MPAKTVRKPVAKKASKFANPVRELIRISFEILGRFFPDQSGKDNETVRQDLNVPINGPISHAQWKKGACDFLADNLKV